MTSTEDRSRLLETLVEHAPIGLMLLIGDRLLVANPAARSALGVTPTEPFLNVNGPDGLLSDRIAEAARNQKPSFLYHLASERVLKVVPVVTKGNVLVCLEDVTATQKASSSRERTLAQAFHDLKTPLAVLSLGLSNLTTYYDKMTDNDRQSNIQELSEQVGEMTLVMARLYERLRNLTDGHE